MRALRWRYLISISLTVGVLLLAYLNRSKVISAFESLDQAQPAWLVAALAMEFASFFLSSQVYAPALRSLGRHISALRLWATTLVAIILSQSFPAGGVASYAFLVQAFRRQGISAGHAALLASLEALSYAIAMLLLFGFSLFYITFSEGFSAAGGPSLVAALVAFTVIGLALFVGTRDQATVTRWLLGLKQWLAHLLRREWSDAPVRRIVEDLARGRALITERRAEMLWLICLQILALTGHSLTMLAVLYGLGAPTSLFVVMSGFGIALISSTFNVLPGGGGTVEAALVIALQSLGVGDAAIIAAVIFRLLNFWLLTPVAAICYRWLIHGPRPAPELATGEQIK